MITKLLSIKVSEAVFNIVDTELEDLNTAGCKLSAYLETFNNCREQGFVINVRDSDFEKEGRVRTTLYVWVCLSRGGDDIMVVMGTNSSTYSMFDEEAYSNRKLFSYTREHDAADYIVDQIKQYFKLETD